MSSLAGALVPWNTDEKPVKDEAHPEAAQDEEMEDLFGNEDAEDSKPDDPPSPAASSDNVPTPERERRRAQEYEEEEAPPEITVEVREALVEFPNIPVPKSSKGENWVIRMPNFVKVDSKPFHHETYMGPEQEEDEAQQAETLREKSMSIKLKVENTMRWRWTKDAEDRDRRQSNSRIIRWSDGTLSLRLGKELFDINQSIDTSGGKSFGASQSAQSAGKSQGLTYIVAQHKRSQVLQSEALVTGYMSLQPTGMQSETHRMLVRAVGQKHNKVARLRMAPDPTMDPEREQMELMKLNARKSKRKADSDGGRQRKASRKSRGASVWSDDEEDAGPLSASDEEEERAGSSGRRSKYHRDRPADEERQKDAEYQFDGFVVRSDEEGSDGGGNGEGRHQDDELDRLDAQINESHTTKRRRGSAGSKEETRDQDGDEVMDVESEEEEDEHRVRPVGRTGGSRRRLQIEEEEEDE
ncbi:RNA polymerase II-associated protein [Mycena maculata]|uniref:RNA polymerase II-associated protein n=1 Tax=Mycena maculata TaxID=230809 RepID=A0AAD7N515_9AGAR|nr:RNA polymerase II-associated protein [Mycena maculata]